eukprot:428469_1
MKQKLTDCIENTIPKIKYVMKQTFSTIFDLNNLSHCISLLFMFSREDFERFGNQRKIEIDEWDKLLDNTININTGAQFPLARGLQMFLTYGGLFSGNYIQAYIFVEYSDW